jgi:hypothetical protein
MTDPADRLPLWRVVRNAGQHARIDWEHVDGTRYAAELRAIADWLVPERDSESLPLEEQVAWAVHYTLRQRLLDEADKADVGK